MKIIVLVKIVDGEVNIFDQSALETALCVPDAEVTVLSMCPPSASEKLRSLTRLGVKRAVLISDPAYAGSDTLATSYILSEAIKKIDYDLILCGRQTTDGDTAQVGPCTATMLGIKPVTNVMKVEFSENSARCETRCGEETAEFPTLMTIERICNLRFPSIRSKVGDIEIWDNSIINADLERCGLNGSPTKVLKVFEKNSDIRKCKFIKPAQLVDVVKESLAAKGAEDVFEESDLKLENVWIVGEEVRKQAEKIAKSVSVINKINPYEIARLASEKKPKVILWNADLWGRKNAPIVSALLNTGLCADCTALETDGKKLYMYRPARSGNVTAKIECRKNPQMATVRTVFPSGEFIISVGRGGAEYFDSIKTIAGKLNAEVCASRGLVDSGAAPYEMQVGVTGKSVSPKVYIAAGISGAVQHTAAIESAKTIIAINKDKNARIFDCADYGIVADIGEVLEEIKSLDLS